MWNEGLVRRGPKGMEHEGLFKPAADDGPLNIIGLLKTCTTSKDLAKGSKLHAYIREHKYLLQNVYIGSTLVNMYAKCGALSKAQRVLDDLPMRDTVAWSALIAGYAQQGQGEEALECFDDMLHEGISPSVVTFVSVLRACGTIRAAAKGEKIHDKIVNLGMLGKDVILGTALVDMYVKYGTLAKAQQVLEDLPIRNVVTWSALIAGYSQQGKGEEALKCLDDMVREGHSPDEVTFISVLKACGSIGAAAKGEVIHDKIVCMGMLKKNIMLANTLVDMYVKCGASDKAKRVLEELSIRNVITWTTLIAGYAQQGQGDEALKCFDDMLHEGHSPNAVTFICILKACGSIGAAAKGKEIHDMIISLGMLEKDVMLGSTLVDMYAKCGALNMAQQVLKELPVRNLISWNALIVGYAQQGQGVKTLECFRDILCEGHSPDAVTFVCVLKACGNIRLVDMVEEIHVKLVSLCMLENDVVLGNALVDTYVKCGELGKAQRVLEELSLRNVVTWSALIDGYVQQGQGEEALKCFADMLHEGHFPTGVTFSCALKACGCIGAAIKGEEIHDKIVGLGMLENDIVLGSTLVDMYVKCGAVAKAQRMLEELPISDAVTWSALISGYAQQGQEEEAVKCFDDMLHQGHTPDAVTVVCVLKVCGSIGAVIKGEEIHDKFIRSGMLDIDIVLGNALLDMYMKCGALSRVQQALKKLPTRDVVTWTILIAGYVHQGQGEEALKSFDDMLCEGLSPDAVTFICILNACGSIGAATKAKEIHDKIISLGMLEKDIHLGSALVNAYTKCGAFIKAKEVFDELPILDLATWNVLIAGFAHQGQSWEALNCFELMQSNGVKPNSITFTSILNICSHSGLLDQAETYFLVMITNYGMVPNLEHYCCMIDLFGRAGMFNKALSVIAVIPSTRWLSSWLALLGACYKWVEVKIGELAFEHACHLNTSNAAFYILMTDIYTADKISVATVSEGM